MSGRGQVVGKANLVEIARSHPPLADGEPDSLSSTSQAPRLIPIRGGEESLTISQGELTFVPSLSALSESLETLDEEGGRRSGEESGEEGSPQPLRPILVSNSNYSRQSSDRNLRVHESANEVFEVSSVIADSFYDATSGSDRYTAIMDMNENKWPDMTDPTEGQKATYQVKTLGMPLQKSEKIVVTPAKVDSMMPPQQLEKTREGTMHPEPVERLELKEGVKKAERQSIVKIVPDIRTKKEVEPRPAEMETMPVVILHSDSRRREIVVKSPSSAIGQDRWEEFGWSETESEWNPASCVTMSVDSQVLPHKVTTRIYRVSHQPQRPNTIDLTPIQESEVGGGEKRWRPGKEFRHLDRHQYPAVNLARMRLHFQEKDGVEMNVYHDENPYTTGTDVREVGNIPDPIPHPGYDISTKRTVRVQTDHTSQPRS